MAVDNSATIVKIRAEIEGLQGLNQLKTAIRGIDREAKNAGNDLNFVNSKIKELSQVTGNSINNLRLQKQAFEAVRNSARIGSIEYKNATQRIKELNRELGKTQTAGGGGGRLASLGAVASAGFFGGPEALLGAGVGALFGPQGAFAGAAIGAQVAQLRKAAVASAEYAQQLARLKIALQGVTNSADEYNRALNAINNISETLNVPISEATRGFTKLTAAVIGAGGNVGDAETVFRGVTSAIKATGGTAQDVEGALLAMSQVFSKGKLSAEELQGQLGERLPGAVTAFAQATGRSLPQLAKDLEQGAIGLNDVMKFSDELQRRHSANAEAMARSSEESGARMKVALDKLGIAFGEFFKPVKVGIDDLIASFANMVTKAIQAVQLVQMGLKLTAKEREDVTLTARKIAETRYPGIGGLPKRLIEQPLIEQSLLLDKLRLKGYEAGVFQVPGPSTRTVFEEPKGTKPGPKPRKVPVQRLADFEARSELGFELAQKRLRVEELITEAKNKGNQYDAAMLPLIGGILQQSTKIQAAEQKVVDLTENKAELLKQGMSIREWNSRYDVAAETIETERLNRQTAFLKLQQQEGEISKKVLEEEVNARALIQRMITDAQMQSVFLTEEDRKRMEINRVLADVIDKVYGKLTNEKLLEAIRELRKALEDAANAGKDFGTKLAKSFADVVKESGDLAANLGSTLGNAFLGLGDQLADFVQTGKMQFADFARSVLNDLSRILIRFAMFQALKAVVPGGSALGKFLGFADGGIMTSNGSMPLKRYANGGIATSPQIAMFGEGSRPEAYVPLPDGRSIPVTMRGGGAEAGNIVVNVDAAGSSVEGNAAQANKLGEALGAAVRAELIRQKRPGGLLG
jgi:lambda family phage tail tape measure protein